MKVALTFDTEFPGRPASAGVEDRILASLDAAGVKATFFLQGRWTRANPDTAGRIVEAGHTIGNHSNYHAPMNGLDDDLLRRDVRKAEDTIRTVTGVDPRPWFRCPFGAGQEDERVLAALEELGYRHIGWDVDPRDWEEGRTAEELERLVLEGLLEDSDDKTVLLHAWPLATGEALPMILGSLGAGNVQFVPVGGI